MSGEKEDFDAKEIASFCGHLDHLRHGACPWTGSLVRTTVRAAKRSPRRPAAVIVLSGSARENGCGVWFRQEDNFYYLSGVAVPGAGLLIAPAVEAKGETPARTYTEILFLPPRNLRLEKFTGRQMGADDADAPKQTGFDRVEETGNLPVEVAKLLAGQRPVVYTEDALAWQREPRVKTCWASFSTAMR